VNQQSSTAGSALPTPLDHVRSVASGTPPGERIGALIETTHYDDVDGRKG
jgi:hypothetical protein